MHRPSNSLHFALILKLLFFRTRTIHLIHLFLINIFIFYVTPITIFGIQDHPRLFIMLDIDNTLMDRISPDDQGLEKILKQENYTVQHLTFTTLKSISPNFYNLYQNPKEDFFATQLKILKIDPNQIIVEEISVIRPSIKNFIENLLLLSQSLINTHILICSRNDNTRNQHLIKHLDLLIHGNPFHTVVEFVPREHFRVEINLNQTHPIPAKSAIALRNHYQGLYAPITDNDFVMLIDQLPNDQFIIKNKNRDLNVPISGFHAIQHTQQERIRDEMEIQTAFEKIQVFIKQQLQNSL